MKSKKLKTFENIMKENFPSMVQAIDFHIIIILPKIKDKENLKSSKTKGDSYLQRSSHKTIS